MVQSGVNGYRWYLKAQKDVFPFRKRVGEKKTSKTKSGVGWRARLTLKDEGEC